MAEQREKGWEKKSSPSYPRSAGLEGHSVLDVQGLINQHQPLLVPRLDLTSLNATTAALDRAYFRMPSKFVFSFPTLIRFVGRSEYF
jgi:hypothetical protein